MSSSVAPICTVVGRGRAVIVLLAACALVLAAGGGPALGDSPPSNGQIAFIRYLGDEAHLFVIRPNGSGERELPLPTQGFLPAWSPDGRRIAVSTFADDTIRPLLVDPVSGNTSIIEVPGTSTDLALICRTWTPDSRRLLCQGDSFSATRPETNGVYSVRADGTGIRRLTRDAFPPVFGDEGSCGGGDIPGSVSPDGERFVFMRARCGTLPAPDLDQVAALFVARTDGSGGMRQITPYGLPWSHEEGMARWSPDGRQILFATADGKLVTVRPDGSHLREVRLHGAR